MHRHPPVSGHRGRRYGPPLWRGPARRGRVTVLAAGLFGLIALAGCSLDRAASPPAQTGPRPAERQAVTVPVIVIPGMLGSRLADRTTGRTAWPSIAAALPIPALMSRLALPLTGAAATRNAAAGTPGGSLVPDGLIRRIAWFDFYDGLIRQLELERGPCVAPHEIQPGSTCVLLAWDWRRDLVEAAVALDEAIAALRRVHAAPELKVDVVAHSAGALVVRYYERFGGTDVLDSEAVAEAPMTGAAALRRVVQLAPPNNGSIYGLQRVMRGERMGLSWLNPEVMTTMPSIYQLLPHPDRESMIGIDGAPINVDLYDIDNWRRFQEAIFRPQAQARIAARFPDPQKRAAYASRLEQQFVRGLARGARFHRALDAPRRPSS